MRRPATLALTTALAVAAWGLVPLAGSAAPRGSDSPALSTSGWCTFSGEDACIQSATRNGVVVPADDPTWNVTAGTPPWLGESSWSVRTATDDFDLGAASLADTWTITMLTKVNPRIVATYGNATSVTRSYVGEGFYRVVITAKPVTLLRSDGCNVAAWPWTCPDKAVDQWDAYLGGNVYSYEQWDDVTQRESMYGMNISTNVALTSIPPELTTNPDTGEDRLLLRMANPHRHPDDTVFKGFLRVRIPNTFLKAVYGIDDPASMTSTGLKAGAGSGVTTVKQEAGDGAMLVDASGLTFSARELKVDRGSIKPSKPTKVKGKRISKHKAKVTYAKAKARGSKITGYQARCTSATNVRTATVKSGTKITVPRLKANTKYNCKVRAKSKAGYSPWSVSKAKVAKRV